MSNLDYVKDVVTTEDNATFQVSEFKNALFSMYSDKALGPDGQNPTFLKDFGIYME